MFIFEKCEILAISKRQENKLSNDTTLSKNQDVTFEIKKKMSFL